MSAVAFNLYKPKKSCCIVIGLGLIGKSISDYLRLYGEQINNGSASFSWSSSDEITNVIKHFMRSSGSERLELVWSAGYAGFSATDKEMENEYSIFVRVMNNLVNEYGSCLTINFISSAGGIYEGVDDIKTVDEVCPVRPYGKWKLKQEEFILSLKITARIYRVSSAYGFAHGTTRFGLVDNLIQSAITNKNTLIYAPPSTLRDYIFVKDIARFVIEGVVFCRPSCIQITASGRSVSVNMLINSITQLLKKRVNVTYSSNNANSKNIVFPSQLLPNNMVLTSIEESIKTIAVSRFYSKNGC